MRSSSSCWASPDAHSRIKTSAKNGSASPTPSREAPAGPRRTKTHGLPDYFRRNLADPLAFGPYHFNLMPTGEGYLGGGLFLRPRDHLKLAQLFHDGGRWRGKQIVSGRWVKAATSPQASINGPDDYGFGWWLISYPYKGKTVRAFHTSGNGGQMAIAIPELDLPVVFQAANYNNYPVWSKFRDEWLPQYVIGAVKN